MATVDENLRLLLGSLVCTMIPFSPRSKIDSLKLTGCYVEIFLQGILYAQVSTLGLPLNNYEGRIQCNHYFHYYRDDHCIIKVVVAGLLILTTLKSCQSL